MPTINYKTSLKLDWIVVGGGLSGLATAYVLQRAGHRVRILEELEKLGSPASGLRVPPNLSKIFREWFGEEELLRHAVKNVGTPWYDLETGEYLGYNHWKPTVMKETGGDFLMMHHEDAHRLLYKLAADAGVKVEFGAKVTSVKAGNPKPIVELEGGRVLTADLIVGADGPTSVVRRTAFETEDDAQPTGLTVLGGLIPATEMLKDAELAKFVLADEWPIFMGSNRSLCCHPVRAKKEFAVQLYWPDSEAGPDNKGKESWYEVIPTTSLDFSPYANSVQKLMKMVPFLTRTRHMSRKAFPEDWMDDSGRIVLVGEAAHPWLPGGSHTTSMAVEDGVVLGTLFSHLDSWSQVGSFFSAYQELREARTKAVLREEISNSRIVSLPPGPAREARNSSFKPRSEDDTDGDLDEGALMTELDAFAEIFCYDASDAAEEWWVDWGRFSRRSAEGIASGPPQQMVSFSFGAVTSVMADAEDRAH
ncbi:FAD/NAD-P-binding domain-containing protein [Cristinia sonorae]|uniref:FAD/NAD-P-binding domain-containing protein n=1 Tax=Cristinia sonorae TaxID=1940300 RepID=A0A8K0XSJ7_9AGAR|nr:FAD/NAD-P-binding domain-containing protein [Cristinia sonorae]